MIPALQTLPRRLTVAGLFILAAAWKWSADVVAKGRAMKKIYEKPTLVRRVRLGTVTALTVISKTAG